MITLELLKKYKYHLAVVVGLSLVYLLGYTQGKKTVLTSTEVTQNKEVQVDQVHKRTVITKDKNGNETTTISDDSIIRRQEQSKSASRVETPVKYQRQLSLIYVVDLMKKNPQSTGFLYQQHISGPVTAGVFGAWNGTIGVTFGIDF
jgi:hypothetical protein